MLSLYVLPKIEGRFIKKSKPVSGAAWWREWPTGFVLTTIGCLPWLADG